MMPRLAALLAGVAAWMVIGGTPGLILGACCSALLPIVFERLEPQSDRTRREQLARDSIRITRTMAMALTAGLPMNRALDYACTEVAGPSKDELQRLLTAWQRSGSPEAFRDAAVRVEAWQPWLRATARAVNTGAPLADVLQMYADIDTRRHHDDVLRRARTLGVRATVPVALLVLPAFVLLGVVPLVASLARVLLPNL